MLSHIAKEPWRSLRVQRAESWVWLKQVYREKLSFVQLWSVWVYRASSTLALAAALLLASLEFFLLLPLVVRLRSSAQLERERRKRDEEFYISRSKYLPEE